MEDRLPRKLAAILCADMVGYSRLLEQDEVGTVQRLRADRNNIIDPTIARHGGEIIRLAGDGVLIEFSSVTDAVQCAIDIQRAMVERNSERSADQAIVFRIGVNVGDIIVEDDNLHGEGINVAARLEALAPPGGILTSEEVAHHVDGKVSAELEFVEERRVKNIERPVRIYRVVLESTAEGRRSMDFGQRQRLAARRNVVISAVVVLAIAAGAMLLWLAIEEPADSTTAQTLALSDIDVFTMPTGPTVAVLPFDNLSGEPDQEFFSDGVTEEIISTLSRFQGLRVLARSSTERFKGRPVDARQLRQELNADFVVEGSVRKAGDSIRVTAQLLNTKNGDQLWAQSYNRDLTPGQILAVQDEIASQVSAAIASPSGGAIARLARRSIRRQAPDHLTSYECVLQSAGYALNATDEQAIRKSVSCLLAAVERDPDYADAWAALSTSYGLSYSQGYKVSDLVSGDLLALARETAHRAVELAPESPRAHFVLAEAFYKSGKIERFHVEADRALMLNPNDPFTLGVLGNHLAYSGEWEKGRRLAEKGIELLPGVHAKWWWFATAKDHFRKGQYEQAIKVFERSFYPNWWVSHLQYAYTYGQMGESEKAGESVAEVLRLRPEFAIKDAVAFYRRFHFEPSYIEKMAEGLRKAGMPE